MPNEASRILDRGELDALLGALRVDGFDVVGPTVREGTVTFAPIATTADLPVGLEDEQDGGRYRLKERSDLALFATAVGASSPRRWLQRPRERLFSTRGRGRALRVLPSEPEPRRVALIGVRACDLAAVAVSDRVLLEGEYADPHYRAGREGLFVVAAHCTRSVSTCFCASAGCGPRAAGGYDLALTELDEGVAFLVEAGSERGAALLERLGGRLATASEHDAADQRIASAATSQTRALPDGTVEALRATLRSPRYDDVAARCLACGNCTLVCPTCFCTTVDDRESLDGDVERWRSWDSCFNASHSYVHGGSVRSGTRERYRQWLTHKLSTWHEQFGTTGCTGCGRCITWCPVGIDLTAEAGALVGEALAEATP